MSKWARGVRVGEAKQSSHHGNSNERVIKPTKNLNGSLSSFNHYGNDQVE